jgi:hypothetical protein
MNYTKIAGWAFVLLFLTIVGFSAFSSYTNIYDTNVAYNADYKQLINDRSSAYDNIMKTIKQNAMVAKANDTAFREIVNALANGQKDGENVTMKWIQQSNPAASFVEVSALYKNLSRQIEGDRKTIVEKERRIGLLVAEQEKLLNGFWANMFFKSEVRLSTLYKPITSSAMEEINKTGKDDNTDVF